MARPSVSAVMIFLDAERFMDEAIESVLAQSRDDWELLLVDDGSTDRSTAIALRHAAQHPGRIRYFEHEGHANRGMSASRNLGIANAAASYIAFIDADDVWVPHKLAEQIAIMQAHPQAAMVFGATRYWHGWTRRAEDEKRDHVWRFAWDPEVLIAPHQLLLFVSPFGASYTPSMSNVMLRKSALERIGLFEERFTGLCEDLAFMAKVFLKGHVYHSLACWDWYRQHEHSCCVVADLRGETGRHTARFYQWLDEYFRREGVSDPRLLRELDQVLFRINHPLWSRFTNRLLRAS